MKNLILSALAAAAVASAAGAAVAQSSLAPAAGTTTTTTTWTDEYGNIIREHSRTERFAPLNDPSIQVRVGAELPRTVTLHPLPEAIRVPDRDRYSYVIVQDRPLIVERDTRRVIHLF